MPSDFTLACVLFDLDGTLVDTAPDLVACLNHALAAHHIAPVSAERIKPFISHGAAAMIKASVENNNVDQKAILNTLLEHYQNNIFVHSRFFDGISELLTQIEASGLKWGIITNKRKRFTEPLMDALGLSKRAACIISGDSTANSKPHPEPMLAGCKQAQVQANQCVYIGDAAHDITAGKRANMKTLAATYGYIKTGDNPNNWGADALISHPNQLSQWITTQL